METAVVSSQVEVESEVKPELEQWRSRIEAAWSKTVQSIVEVGKLVKQAKDKLGASYKQLEGKLPFSAGTATNFTKIAEHPVLSDSEYWNKLPSALSTLYYLSMVDQAKLLTFIGSGAITPDMTLARAKALAHPPTLAAANDATASAQKSGDGNAHVPVVLSIPKPEDVKKFLEDAEKFAQKYKGTLDHPRNHLSVNYWRREIALGNAEHDIAESEGKLQNITLDQLRMLEAAASYLSKPKKAGQADNAQTDPGATNDSCLPHDYMDFEALSKLLGETEITKKFIKKWSKANAVPTQLALADVQHEVYVWEQVRQVAGREDEKGARKRLEKIAAKSKNPAIARSATEALDVIARFEK